MTASQTLAPPSSNAPKVPVATQRPSGLTAQERTSRWVQGPRAFEAGQDAEPSLPALEFGIATTRPSPLCPQRSCTLDSASRCGGPILSSPALDRIGAHRPMQEPVLAIRAKCSRSVKSQRQHAAIIATRNESELLAPRQVQERQSACAAADGEQTAVSLR